MRLGHLACPVHSVASQWFPKVRLFVSFSLASIRLCSCPGCRRMGGCKPMQPAALSANVCGAMTAVLNTTTTWKLGTNPYGSSHARYLLQVAVAAIQSYPRRLPAGNDGLLALYLSLACYARVISSARSFGHDPETAATILSTWTLVFSSSMSTILPLALVEI